MNVGEMIAGLLFIRADFYESWCKRNNLDPNNYDKVVRYVSDQLNLKEVN